MCIRDRLPDDTRAAASLPVGVRFQFSGEPEKLEVEYETETSDLGYRGAGAGTHFVLYRGSRRIDQAEASLGRGRVELSTGKGPETATLYLPEGMRPRVLSLQGHGAEIKPPGNEPRWLCTAIPSRKAGAQRNPLKPGPISSPVNTDSM